MKKTRGYNRVHARLWLPIGPFGIWTLPATVAGKDLALRKLAVNRVTKRGGRLVADQSLTLEE